MSGLGSYDETLSTVRSTSGRWAPRYGDSWWRSVESGRISRPRNSFHANPRQPSNFSRHLSTITSAPQLRELRRWTTSGGFLLEYLQIAFRPAYSERAKVARTCFKAGIESGTVHMLFMLGDPLQDDMIRSFLVSPPGSDFNVGQLDCKVSSVLVYSFQCVRITELCFRFFIHCRMLFPSQNLLDDAFATITGWVHGRPKNLDAFGDDLDLARRNLEEAGMA